jgi:uncharacterized protein (TIRG00374 family)
VYLFRSVDLPELGRQLRAAHWGWALLSTALAPFGLWVRARRWWYLLPPGANPPNLLPAIMIGYMANNVLPLRAGEIVRVYIVARRWRAVGSSAHAHPFWTTLATLVVERVLDSLAIVLILAVLVLLVPVPRFLEVAALTVLAIDLIGIAVLIALVAAPDRCARLVARLTGRWPRLQQRALAVFRTFVYGLDGIRTPAHIVPLILWTVGVWLAPALAAWTMLEALNLRLPFVASWAILAFVGLGISIPSAPGYVGVFHAAAVLAVGLFGVAQAPALGYALLFHASQIVPVTVIGWLYLLREQVSLGEAAAARPAAPATGPADP